MSQELRQKKNRRSLKNLLIEPFKQVRFGVTILLLSSVFIIATIYTVVQSFLSQYEQVMTLFNVVDPEARWDFIHNDVFYANLFNISIIYLAYFLVLFYMIFKITHRFYGPTVSINRFLNQIIEGDYKCRVSIRKNDELQGLVKKLNLLAETLEKRHNKESKENESNIKN